MDRVGDATMTGRPPPPPPPSDPDLRRPLPAALPGLPIAAPGVPHTGLPDAPSVPAAGGSPTETLAMPSVSGSPSDPPLSSRPDLDAQLRALIGRSGEAQRQRVELQDFHNQLVRTISLLTELDEHRHFLAERVAVLEDRLVVVERLSANAADLALDRTEQLDNRLSRVERAIASRQVLRGPGSGAAA